jgi:hypothetical protein
MGNDISCKIVGIGSIKVKMYDDIVITLIDVMHIPKHRKHLVYLGILDSFCYICTVQGRVLKVSKGILVVMKGKRIENLYQLEGRTEINQVGVVSKGASD